MKKQIKNALSASDKYTLAKLVEQVKSPFPSMEKACRFFEEHCGRSISISNIKTACKAVGVPLEKIVTLATSDHPFARMAKHINENRQMIVELQFLVMELKKEILAIKASQRRDDKIDGESNHVPGGY